MAQTSVCWVETHLDPSRREESRRCRLKPAPLERSPAVPEWNFMQKRFYRAMAAYGVLALMAEFTLDGKFRIGVWILLAGLAAKTCIAYKTSNL